MSGDQELNSQLNEISFKNGFIFMPIFAHHVSSEFLQEIVSWFDENRDPNDVKQRHALYLPHFGEDSHVDIFILYYISMYYFFIKEYHNCWSYLECCNNVIFSIYGINKSHLMSVRMDSGRMLYSLPKKHTNGIVLVHTVLNAQLTVAPFVITNEVDLKLCKRTIKDNLVLFGDVRSFVDLLVREYKHNGLLLCLYNKNGNCLSLGKNEFESLREMRKYFPHTHRIEFFDLLYNNVMDTYGSVLCVTTGSRNESFCEIVYCDN